MWINENFRQMYWVCVDWRNLWWELLLEFFHEFFCQFIAFTQFQRCYAGRVYEYKDNIWIIYSFVVLDKIIKVFQLNVHQFQLTLHMKTYLNWLDGLILNVFALFDRCFLFRRMSRSIQRCIDLQSPISHDLSRWISAQRFQLIVARCWLVYKVTENKHISI